MDFDNLEWYHWLLIAIIVIVLIIIFLLYLLRQRLKHNAEVRGIAPESDIPGYTGGWAPWDVVNDINAINKIACADGWNPNTAPSIDPETNEPEIDPDTGQVVCP